MKLVDNQDALLFDRWIGVSRFSKSKHSPLEMLLNSNVHGLDKDLTFRVEQTAFGCRPTSRHGHSRSAWRLRDRHKRCKPPCKVAIISATGFLADSNAVDHQTRFARKPAVFLANRGPEAQRLSPGCGRHARLDEREMPPSRVVDVNCGYVSLFLMCTIWFAFGGH
jgi:hypothetical protein